jgi:arylsulfatase
MSLKSFIFTFVFFQFSFFQAVTTPPNIILIITDDQGYGDISAHGNPHIQTPNIDFLATQGASFTDFTVSPTCSPTRAAIMTGQHEFNGGVTHTINERERLRPDSTTLPQLLKSVNYTTGIFGKWHLGDEIDRLPNARGFDEMFIHGAGGIGQSYNCSCGDVPGNQYQNPIILHNQKFVPTQGYCTDIFFDQARQWITQQKKTTPFFCYLATNAPHSPYIAKPEDLAKYAAKFPNDSDAANFYAMIDNIDQNVGKLLQTLKEQNILENTLIIFMNDNGGTAGTNHYNANLRGSKLSPYQGGIKAMSLWYWSNHLKAQKINQPAAHIDILPTLAAITQADLSTLHQKPQGINLFPYLTEPNTTPQSRTFYIHSGRWPQQTNPNLYRYANAAIRVGNHKLVSSYTDYKIYKKAPSATISPKWELYDLSADPSESHDLSGAQPDLVKTLLTTYDQWFDSIQPDLVNEAEPIGKPNPFKLRYEAQQQAAK